MNLSFGVDTPLTEPHAPLRELPRSYHRPPPSRGRGTVPVRLVAAVRLGGSIDLDHHSSPGGYGAAGASQELINL